MDIKVRIPSLFRRDSDEAPNSAISERLDRYINQGPREIPLSPRPITRAPRARPAPQWLD